VARASFEARLWAMRCASEQYLGRRPVGGTGIGVWQKRQGVVDIEYILRVSPPRFRTDQWVVSEQVSNGFPNRFRTI
jgi:hypothetical protein